MNHDFVLAQGFNDITVMYCKKCGKSYALSQYRGHYNKTVWEEMNFVDFKGNPVPSPAQSCELVEEEKK